MNIKIKEDLERIIKSNHEIDIEEEKEKNINDQIDIVEDILSKYSCKCINREYTKSYMRASFSYDCSYISQTAGIMFIFNLFRPSVLLNKKDYFNEMKKRGYKNFTVDYKRFCIRFDVDYICEDGTYKIV